MTTETEHVFEDHGSASLDVCIFCGQTLADIAQSGEDVCLTRQEVGDPAEYYGLTPELDEED